MEGKCRDLRDTEAVARWLVGSWHAQASAFWAKRMIPAPRLRMRPAASRTRDGRLACWATGDRFAGYVGYGVCLPADRGKLGLLWQPFGSTIHVGSGHQDRGR